MSNENFVICVSFYFPLDPPLRREQPMEPIDIGPGSTDYSFEPRFGVVAYPGGVLSDAPQISVIVLF